MSMAFVLGNGISRQGLDLKHLESFGPVYGCNALYREFVPTVLVATDRPIAEQIQHSGYAKKHRFYTRRPIEELGARGILDKYWGYSSGPAALAIAADDKNTHIYMIGFDMGPVNSFKNRIINGNMSVDQRNAGASITPASNPTYTGNWVKQMRTVMEDYSKCLFYRVYGATTAPILEFDCLTNLNNLTMEEFRTRINM